MPTTAAIRANATTTVEGDPEGWSDHEEGWSEDQATTAADRQALLDLIQAAEQVTRELPRHDDLAIDDALRELVQRSLNSM
jgi:Spy/CpxP family protein refolding chaperone